MVDTILSVGVVETPPGCVHTLVITRCFFLQNKVRTVQVSRGYPSSVSVLAESFSDELPVNFNLSKVVLEYILRLDFAVVVFTFFLLLKDTSFIGAGLGVI